MPNSSDELLLSKETAKYSIKKSRNSSSTQGDKSYSYSCSRSYPGSFGTNSRQTRSVEQDATNNMHFVVVARAETHRLEAADWPFEEASTLPSRQADWKGNAPPSHGK
eukprot:scaffold256085_cov18-Prasinocladus_malaysianus.AAC.1